MVQELLSGVSSFRVFVQAVLHEVVESFRIVILSYEIVVGRLLQNGLLYVCQRESIERELST